MPCPLVLIALALLAEAQPAPGEDPRAVVRLATNAVRGDSAAPLRARWTARLGRDPSDRSAALGLATLERLTYDYESAEGRYRRLFADSAQPDRHAVYARLGLAEGRDAQGRRAGLVEALARARADAHRVDDAVAEGAALFWMGSVLGPMRGGAVALAYLDSALRVLPDSAVDLLATARCRRAQIMGAVGQPGARAERAAATALVRRSGDPTTEFFCLRAIANEYDFRGEQDSTIATVRRIVALRRGTRDRSGLAFAYAMLADELRDLGSYGEVLEAFRTALVEARASRNGYVEGTVSLGFGAVALALRDPASAAEHIERAIATFEALGDTGSAWQARHFRPLVSVAVGDAARARRQLDEALAWERRTGQWWNMIGLYQQLAYAHMREGDLAAARAALDSGRAAVPRTPGTPSPDGYFAFHYGRVALLRGDLDAAARHFTAYLEGLSPEQRLPRYEARAQLAAVHAGRGDLAGAERELTLASDELDAWRAGLAERELRIFAFQASGHELSPGNSAVASVLAALAVGGRAGSAFALAERRRARELADHLTRVRALRVAGGAGGGAPRPAAAVNAALDARALAAAIPDDRTAVVEFVTGETGAPTTVFVVRRAAAPGEPVRATVLAPADSLVRQVARATALVEGGGDPGPLARALGAALLDPVAALAGPDVGRLVIVPDGPLHRVPWDALRLADGRYAAERYAISIVPSAGVASSLWREHGASRANGADGAGNVRLLAFGDPAFPRVEDARAGAGAAGAVDIYRSAFDAAGGLPRLEASAREARLVARYAPAADVRLREAASAAYLKRASLEPYRVLHFATHALVDDRSAARTALALAPGEGESGFVGPADLAALRLRADLVVLSACRSAGGVVVDGEGVQGLTAPLLQAGARAVVATQWRISDRKTVAFVRDFYDALARGLPVDEALRAAKLEAIGRGAPPGEWAAFTAVGDPFVTVPLRAPAPAWGRWGVALAAAALVAAAAAAAYSRRTRRPRMTEAR